MAIAEDEWGKIWIGTGVGVSYLQDGQVISLDMKELEQAQYAFGFYVEKGYVWIATDRGIVRYRQDDGFMSLVGKPQGLPIDKFFQIVHDDKGYLWLSSNRGIWRIRYDQAHEVADGALDKIEFEHYDQDDGMASSQANGGSNPAAIKSNSGTI
ncbi:diguanylate cyclase, partial [Vibrio xuii]